MESCTLCKELVGAAQGLVQRSGNTFHRACFDELLNLEHRSSDEESDSEDTTHKPDEITFATTNENQISEESWECQHCGIGNFTSTKRCDLCAKQRYTHPPSTDESTETSNIDEQCDKLPLHDSSRHADYDDREESTKQISDDDDHYQERKNYTIKWNSKDYAYENQMSREDPRESPATIYKTTNEVKVATDYSSPPSSNSQAAHVVYIPDLPSHMVDSLQLEQLICHRIEEILDQKLHSVRCYSKLGIGVVHVSDGQLRDRLLKLGKLALDPTDGKHLITFIANIELISYVVLQVPEESKNVTLPSTKDIARRWSDLHKGDEPLECDALNAQFPNIYRIVSTALDKLINAPQDNVFKVQTFFAYVYYCADCSFFEDLPRSIAKNRLEDSIANTIGQSNISPSSLYIQVNKQTATACVIVADTARAYRTHSYISIDKHILPKKTALSCRLLIHPVPESLSVQRVIDHPEFKGTVINHKHNGDKLILEISDKDVFQRCLGLGALRIDKQHLVHVDLCSTLRNPEESEIDAETWYESDMVQHSPDIMQFVANPQHPIFHYRWNPEIWLQQFKLVATQKRDHSRTVSHNPKNSTPDQQRHLLRVTAMLNTLAAIRKGGYEIGDRKVKLNLKPELKTIVYDHRSKLERPRNMPLTKTPYLQTTVHVFREDCLVAYQNMVKSGKRPVLLNMASTTSPGGGFRKGDGAQEENIFRRSDYCRSLDADLDEFFQQQPQRLYCTPDCKFEPMSARDKMYPMDEFGAIYTSGITAFRQSEDTGYALMENPLEDVCAIAMAAYRDPELKDNMLAPKYAVGTRKKIENIFAIAHHQKHDSLVLSAFGCGAFKNPPDHIVKLFQSVIEQYAGFFKLIVFAIVDDHNAGRQHNPQGNFQPFANILGEGFVVHPSTSMDRPNTIIGPYRLSGDGSTVNDVSIFDLAPCHYGAKCNEIYDPQHSSRFSHPPLCIDAVVNGKCKSTRDPVHMSAFIHRNQCRNGGECEQINDEKHNREFEHPEYCSDGGTCQNVQEDHLRQYRHLPLCKNSHRCLDFQKKVAEHCSKYRHCALRCSYGNQCVLFHDQAHLEEFQHPFPSPCQQTPFGCSHHNNLVGSKNIAALPKAIQQHCLDFAHVCIWGRNCTDKTSLHWSKSIHIARHVCPHDGNCKKLSDEDHLNSFTHSKIPDIRPPCLYADKCHDRHKVEHKLRYRHSILDEDGIVQYYGSDENTNFVQNQRDNIVRINDYISKHNWKPLPSGSIPREITDWLRTVQPIHRCSPTIFESILLHGHVMSRDYMERLKDPKFVVNSVLQHSRIRRINALKIKALENDAKEYISALVHLEFEKNGFASSTLPPPTSTNLLLPTHGTSFVPKSYSTSEVYVNTINRKEIKLSGTLLPNDMNALRRKSMEIAQASIKLHSNPAGIGHLPDKALGTNKLVFSVLGLNLGHYYGDVIIVFKRKILHHPDASLSVQAATSYASGQCYSWRPWLGAVPGSAHERVKSYHRSKLHAAVPGSDYAAALELMALTSLRLKKKTMNIDLQDILDEWIKVDSHQNIEAHLPQLIPLDYIDHIYIPKNLFNGLTDDARTAINALFQHRITVVPHAGVVNQEMGPSGPTPALKSRSDYQNFVVQALLDRYKQSATHPLPNPLTGFMITIPSTNFDDHYIMPLTISKAYAQYRSQQKHPSKDNIVYIYWKALRGEMMLTLSEEEIDLGKRQSNRQCLICYVAPKLASKDNRYYEQTSYLTSGHPFQHAIVIDRKTYKTKSNTFHIGCDTDDFITYCLEIQRSTGKTTLSHAGPNGIYNHEEMSYHFNKSELDVSRLEHLHLSAGAHTVPVRNLTICFEKQSDLHPTFDKDYKKSGASVTTDQSTSDSNKPKSPGILHRLKNLVFGDQDSSLKPCPQNVNCLLQYSKDAADHNLKFSHPCRYSELCRDPEPHLTHEPNPVRSCTGGRDCNHLDDPLHRASYRHTGQPDFLIPCRDQKKCQDTSGYHRTRYSHGEETYSIVVANKSKTMSPAAETQPEPRHIQPSQNELVTCEWGAQCRDNSSEHRAKYSHPPTTKPPVEKEDRRTPCKRGSKCHDPDPDHRRRYAHSD